VKTLCGEIVKADMVDRSDVQSFDFRTLQLVEERYPDIPTFYLTESVKLLSTEFVPDYLRLSPEETK
jgi:glycerophosphoryl diester phosphodiesterase